MTNVIARIKLKGKNFEIIVDVDKAVELKEGKNVGIGEAVEIDRIFTDSKKGFHAGEDDLQECFGTTDFNEIATAIIKKGEIQLPSEYKEKEREGKIKQVVDFLVMNAVDAQTGRPFTPGRIATALKEAGVNIKNKPIDTQIREIIEQLAPVIPIKIETKKIKLTIPAQHTGRAYGIINAYKESEEWLGNGDLKVVVNVPAGFQMEFYDKINAVTQGSALSEEIKVASETSSKSKEAEA